MNRISALVPSLLDSTPKRDKIDLMNEGSGKTFVGYLSCGANEVVSNSSDGFFALYSSPTLNTSGERYNMDDLYALAGSEPSGGLQAFGGTGSGLNKNGASNYGGQTFDYNKGTLVYGGIERYCIALGPRLQDPNFDSQQPLIASDMAYGTCVDIEITLNNTTYYIPAIIVDVKGHTAPSGIVQTGLTFPYTGATSNAGGNIVEWYTIQGSENTNKSTGLAKFNRSTNIIIYRSEVLQ